MIYKNNTSLYEKLPPSLYEKDYPVQIIKNFRGTGLPK